MKANKSNQDQETLFGGNVEKIFSVSEYIEAVNIALQKFKVKISGEISAVKLATSGHVYFSLKDKSGKAVLDCIIWRGNYQMCGVKIIEGLEVILSGSANIYSPQGRFSFIADTVELMGEGALKKAYDELKNRLEAEGLFSLERKRVLPDFPQRIGVVTSKQGAVINDLLVNLGRFGFKVELIDSRVEGQEAVKDIISALRAFRKRSIDVLVLMRGGGSLEALQAFNNEAIVREVVNFPVPVIAAIGHEKDAPLVALSADFSCSTPSIAATTLNQSWKEAPLKVERSYRDIVAQFSDLLSEKNNIISRAFIALSGYWNIISKKWRFYENEVKRELDKIGVEITRKRVLLSRSAISALSYFSNALFVLQKEIIFFEKTVRANNPEKNLALGYCLLRTRGSIIKTIQATEIGDDIEVEIKDGILNAEVKNKNFKTIKNV